MSVNLAGVSLRNPLIAAAGTAGYVDEIADVLPPRVLGAITTKSITRESREGNAPWRMIDLPMGMLNAIGLANVGLEAFIRDKLPAAAKLDTVVIGSIAGHSIDDYIAVAEAFDASDHLPIVELNVSCPNTETGLEFGTDAARLSELLHEVRPALKRSRMFVKLSPNVGDIVRMAATAIEAGADGLTLINTVAAMAIDIDTRKPRLSRGAGGLSGPAVHPIATRMICDVYRSVAREASVPIIGLGGVLAWQDAAEFVLAGATGIGLGTAMFIDPRQVPTIARGLDRWVQRQGCRSVTELIGQVQM